MNQEKIFTLLTSLYDDTIALDSAWNTYRNFLQMCSDDDDETMEYLLNVVNMTARERLHLRNKIAERGFELTPNELNQYIFLLLMAVLDYSSEKGFN